MKIWTYFKDIVVGAWSLLVGMWVTIRYMFKRPVTQQYPRVRLEHKHFRGPIQFVIFPETGTHNCIACLLCAKICPTNCYVIEGAKSAEEGGQKRPTKFIYNYWQCSLCNLCVQVCPTQTLEHSKDFESASYSRDDFARVDFIAQAKKRSAQLKAAKQETAKSA